MKRDQGSLNKKKIFFSKWNCGDPFVERRESGTDARLFVSCWDFLDILFILIIRESLGYTPGGMRGMYRIIDMAAVKGTPSTRARPTKI